MMTMTPIMAVMTLAMMVTNAQLRLGAWRGH